MIHSYTVAPFVPSTINLYFFTHMRFVTLLHSNAPVCKSVLNRTYSNLLHSNALGHILHCPHHHQQSHILPFYPPAIMPVFLPPQDTPQGAINMQHEHCRDVWHSVLVMCACRAPAVSGLCYTSVSVFLLVPFLPQAHV